MSDKGDQNLAELLVARGLARTKGVTAALPTGVKSKEYAKKLQDLETEARQKRVGVWASSEKNLTAPGDHSVDNAGLFRTVLHRTPDELLAVWGLLSTANSSLSGF